ncbi:MAG: 3,4-dihydroxy-2-butanone-4-phosphate synthase [Spirochaetes bacterium RIFOXYC1_FULL_54_7]|nr:MAG: 3,4-dihydroxy-2-butanone-4-phosphate synthase [Spirochaetes bacterium RIFOXYC1_FULL_54_7]
MTYQFISVEDAIANIRNGKMLIVVDNEDRENEGDLIMAADKVRPEDINFMASQAKGLLCQAITAETAERLRLVPMVANNTSSHTTAFTVSVDAREGTTTGISAFDRAITVKALASVQTIPEDLLRPGHMFPLVAKAGGVLEREGHTEATVDLALLASLSPSGILCEIMDSDGSMARLPRLFEMAREWGLGILTVQNLVHYRQERLSAGAKLDTRQLPQGKQSFSFDSI